MVNFGKIKAKLFKLLILHKNIYLFSTCTIFCKKNLIFSRVRGKEKRSADIRRRMRTFTSLISLYFIHHLRYVTIMLKMLLIAENTRVFYMLFFTVQFGSLKLFYPLSILFFKSKNQIPASVRNRKSKKTLLRFLIRGRVFRGSFHRL